MQYAGLYLRKLVPNKSPEKTEEELAQEISASTASDQIVSTTLRTDDRVIARVTDGIYRQPASALRELISNAYDADASRVVIKTDAPRFDRISIEDDGHGMTPAMLAHLLSHIGGSAKRSDVGRQLGITREDDPLVSPGGRRLIGKIGIGLFSVSQLTHSFQLITKVRGDNYRTIATVILHQYRDDENLADNASTKRFEEGRVKVWREKAVDPDTHGTTIVLTTVRPEAKGTLQSRDIWSRIEASEAIKDEGEQVPLSLPRYHIGRVSTSSGHILQPINGSIDSLPWNEGDTPRDAFHKLVNAVQAIAEQSDPNPQLEIAFDYYLHMAWVLALSVPLPYVDDNLFDTPSESMDVFLISNRSRGSADRLLTPSGGTIRSATNLTEPREPATPFSVIFDDLELFRPIQYRNLPTTSHALQKPIVLVGQCREQFTSSTEEFRGGPLSFEAYLFWYPKIVPKEHRGSLIRIHGASGTLFDQTFMKYQVSELTRLNQITCEIYVHEGLDSALNIDRESFNFAHPHTVFISRWLHNALRQLATTQKKLASTLRELSRSEAATATDDEIQNIIRRVWQREVDDAASSPPAVIFNDSGVKAQTTDTSDSYVFSRAAVTPSRGRDRPSKTNRRTTVVEAKVRAIAQVLVSFNLLDLVVKTKQEDLLRTVYEILLVPEK